MHHTLRVSRIRAPRGTPAAAVLLAVVFIAIGLAISALTPDHVAAATAESAATVLPFRDGPATNRAGAS